ncbi:MAG: dihydrodipicolinate synthase family protein [Bryobacteraceae bacterium]
MRRREFMASLGASGLAFAAAGAKPLRGIFPIAQTPFTSGGKLDLDGLAAEVKFVDRGGVHGLVWPQLASEWSTLTLDERLEGAEAILATAKGLRPAIVIGVQSPEVVTAIEYARRAEKLGADAIIALPPSDNAEPKTMLEYYKLIGKSCGLPFFVQAAGNNMSVDFIVEVYKAVPTLRYVKDEAGQPLERVGPLRQKSSDELKVFSGSHGRTLIEEMRRGFEGSMPATSFADLYAQTWDLWQAGKRREAMDMHARTLFILTEMGNHGPEAMKYILHLRGVFKTYGNRRGRGAPIDEAGKRALREALDYLKPYLKA